MLKEMLGVLARYEEFAEVFGGDLDFELVTKMFRHPASAERTRIFIRELYDLGFITCTDEQADSGLVTIHSAKARKILDIINS